MYELRVATSASSLLLSRVDLVFLVMLNDQGFSGRRFEVGFDGWGGVLMMMNRFDGWW
jgi:hypothetical protein